MKKIYLFPLFVCSFSAVSAPYFGLEIGAAFPNHDVNVNYVSDQVSLSPDSSDAFVGGYMGYSLTNNLALEMGYQQHHFDDEKRVSNGTAANSNQHKGTEWDANLKADQVYLAPVYTVSLTNSRSWSLKMKAGVTFTQYELTTEKRDTQGPIGTSKDEVQLSGSKSSNDWGVMSAIGVEYNVTPALSIGTNVMYQIDSFSSMSTFTMTGSYYF
ncbi:porin family protein [Vibrio sinensis]|uniref:Porin family protein n=1 Tax=Vibrio sinensis TaxID=2302434 RepID=A0A3A6QBM5_9VIBR|nr:AcfA family outer membrane beta-barrel protein [Vibrio sinensis]RJX69697.1 porin family protein [Vibrio sinensis]